MAELSGRDAFIEVLDRLQTAKVERGRWQARAEAAEEKCRDLQRQLDALTVEAEAARAALLAPPPPAPDVEF